MNFEFYTGRHPEAPAFLPAGRGISSITRILAGDPSLRLKHRCAHDDAIEERKYYKKFRLIHFQRRGYELVA
jgi:hypothetical protein